MSYFYVLVFFLILFILQVLEGLIYFVHNTRNLVSCIMANTNGENTVASDEDPVIFKIFLLRRKVFFPCYLVIFSWPAS